MANTTASSIYIHDGSQAGTMNIPTDMSDQSIALRTCIMGNICQNQVDQMLRVNSVNSGTAYQVDEA